MMSLLLLHVWCFLFLFCGQTIAGGDICNVALGKPTSQINTIHNGLSSYAVDGNRDSNFHASSCTHTDSTMDTWWMVDLLIPYNVHSIAITNRNLGEWRLNNIAVYVSDTKPQQIPSPDGSLIGQLCFSLTGSVPVNGPHAYPCDEAVTGRYVYLYKPSNTPLTLCEFEAMAELTNLTSFDLSVGRKSLETPFYWTTIDVPSVLKCAATCMSKRCETTAVQFEQSSRRCECFQNWPTTSGGTVTSDEDWTLMEITD